MIDKITLINTVSEATLELSTTDTPTYILGVTDWSSAKGKHHTHKFFNQIGASVSSTSIEERDVEIQGWIVSETADTMAGKKQVLNSLINPRQRITMHYLDYKLDFLPTQSIRYTPAWAENNEVLCRFAITGVAPDPRWSDDQETTVAAAATLPLFHFPMIIAPQPHAIPPEPPYPAGGVVFGYRQPDLFLTIRNTSSVPVGMRILLRAYGTLSNPRLTNVRTGEFFGLTLGMRGGDSATIVTELGQKSVSGSLIGVEQNLFPYRHIGSSWLQLEVGDNILAYSADSGVDNLDVFVSYYNRYLEVQQ